MGQLAFGSFKLALKMECFFFCIFYVLIMESPLREVPLYVFTNNTGDLLICMIPVWYLATCKKYP